MMLYKLFRTLLGEQDEVRVVEDHRPAFPESSFRSFDDFLSVEGEVLKRETSTVITKMDPETVEGSYLMKCYERHGLDQLRSVGRTGRARREFRNLQLMRSFDVPGVEPAAVGVRSIRSWWPRVSFLITVYHQDQPSLKDLLISYDRNGGVEELNMGHITSILRTLGNFYRRLHGHQFFLMATSTRDILCCRETTGDSYEPVFVDVPNSKRIQSKMLAPLGQAKDLGRLFKGLLRRLDPPVLNSFFETYLPDPLGNGIHALKSRIRRALKQQANETPLTRLVHRFKKEANPF